MERTRILVIVWVLVFAFSTSAFVSAEKDTRNYDTRVVAANSSNEIRVTITPKQDRMTGEPLMFTVDVYNPHEAETKSIFLTIGASPPEEALRMEVSGDEPWFEHENKTLWAKNVVLRPKTHKLVGVSIYPRSQIGNYELNATVSYAQDGNYTTKYDTSTLIIDSHPCSTLRGWFDCNAWWIERLIPILTFILGILSFVGYERLRNWLFTQDT